MGYDETPTVRKMMFKKNEIDVKINEEIVSLLDDIKGDDKGSDKYAKMIDQLTKLHALREKNRVSKETLATVAANVGGIVAILMHERAHVIVSKAFGFVKKIV